MNLAVARVWAAATRFAQIVAATLFVAMFCFFLLQIVSRYVFASPLGWTVEACVISFIWVVFWSSAFLLKESEHVSFTVVYDMAPLWLRRYLLLIGLALMGASFAASLPAVVDYITFMRIETTPVLRLRFDAVYSIFALFVLAVVIRAFVQIAQLLGPQWRRSVIDADGSTEDAGSP